MLFVSNVLAKTSQAAGMGKASAAFATANVGGIALYTFLFFQILLTIQHEQRANADFGDGLAFLTSAFLALVFFAVVDLIWWQ
jgi:hypothetical protein